MKKDFKLLKTIVFTLVFVFTFIVRADGYERVPSPNHLDEQLYAWSGIYLVETGTPVSWSTLGYPKKAEVFKGKVSYKGGLPEAYVSLYSPWLDEPPLFSLIVGFSAHLFKAVRTDFIPSSYIRFPVIFISGATSIFVFLIAKKTAGFWMGILSMLVYGTVPLFVISSRIAMPENFIALLLMMSIYLLMNFYQRPKFIYLLPIPLLAGMAGLAKPTGYFILPLALFFVWKKLFKGKVTSNLVKNSLYLVLGIIPFVLIYIWYGNHYDPEIFKLITSVQGYRPAGFSSLMWYFISPSFGTSILKDSWYVFCLLFGVYFLLRPKKPLAGVLSISFAYWVIIIMLSGGENDLLAWYRFPTFPLLAIFGALGLKLLAKRADFFSTFLTVGMLLGARILFVRSINQNIQPNEYRAIFTILMAPSILYLVLKNDRLKRISRGIIVFVFALGMFYNVKYVYNAFGIECEGLSCPFVPSTSLSKLHLPYVWRFLKLPELNETPTKVF